MTSCSMLLALVLSACGGSTPGSDGEAGLDAGTGDAGLRVLFRVDDEEAERVLFAVAEVEIESDVGGDDRLRDRTFQVIDPRSDESDRVLFPLAPPGTYSRLRVVLAPAPAGADLPSDFTPADATAIVRGTREGVPFDWATSQEATWDVRCDAGVKLPPGGLVDLVVDVDLEGWLEDGISPEELTAAASLRCEEEAGGDGDSDSDTDSEG